MKTSYSSRVRLAAGALMAGLALAGCAKKTANATDGLALQDPPGGPGSVRAAMNAEKRFPLKGEIVTVNAAGRTLIIHHDAIPDYMPSMTMEFIVSQADAENAKAGQRIRGEMVLRNNKVYLEKIWPDDTQTNGRLVEAANALAQETNVRGKEAYREVGETLPDFTLLDQDGRAVSINRFRGKQVMLNFIFTRCPIANMCPAATMKMMALQQAAREAGITNLELVSISFDPAYDSPGVLKEYAEVRGIDLSNWSFLTGPDTAVRNLLAQMGIIREFDGDTIKHTLATLLIDEQGRIIHRVDGSQWDTQEFLGKMRKGA